jgi:hypothetical protein
VTAPYRGIGATMTSEVGFTLGQSGASDGVAFGTMFDEAAAE